MSNIGIEESLTELHQGGLLRDYRREALFGFVRKALPVMGSCLDVGCGTGFMVERMAELGLDVVGIDSSEKLINIAQNRMENRKNITLHVADLLTLPSKGPFDGVLCLDVIEHIEDDAAALNMLYQACRPGGTMILSVPAMSSLFGKRDVMLGHYRRYGRAELMSKLVSAGFVVHRCRFWNMLGVPAYWLSEKVLKKPLNDSLRIGRDSPGKRMVRLFLTSWLKLELILPRLPCGLSLLVMASR